MLLKREKERERLLKREQDEYANMKQATTAT